MVAGIDRFAASVEVGDEFAHDHLPHSGMSSFKSGVVGACAWALW
jgi:hypothetical protein